MAEGTGKLRPKPRVVNGQKYRKIETKTESREGPKVPEKRDRNRESRMAEKNRDPNGLGEYKREVAQFGRA